MEGGVRLKSPTPAWLLLCALLAGGALLGTTQPGQSWDWQPDLVLAQPWRLFSAAFVHFSGMHLAVNLAGMAAVALLGRAAGCDGRAALAWAMAWPLTHLALVLQPGLSHYGGLSGVLHAGVAVAATWLLAGRDRRSPRVGLALWLGLVIKLAAESPWETALQPAGALGVAVAPLAHLSGSAAGLLCAAPLLRRGRRNE